MEAILQYRCRVVQEKTNIPRTAACQASVWVFLEILAHNGRTLFRHETYILGLQGRMTESNHDLCVGSIGIRLHGRQRLASKHPTKR